MPLTIILLKLGPMRISFLKFELMKRIFLMFGPKLHKINIIKLGLMMTILFFQVWTNNHPWPAVLAIYNNFHQVWTNEWPPAVLAIYNNFLQVWTNDHPWPAVLELPDCQGYGVSGFKEGHQKFQIITEAQLSNFERGAQVYSLLEG